MRAVLLLLLLVPLGGCLQNEAPDALDAGTDACARVSAVAPGSCSVLAGDWTFEGGSRTLVQGALGVLPVESSVLTSDLDGADIDVSVWRPDLPAGEPVPIIIQASPYFLRTDEPSGSQDFGLWMIDQFVPHGYAYAQLAVRSTAASGGCDDFRGPHMTADMSQAIDWLVAQDWAAEAVALIGKSYPGSTPWYAAGSGNPAIKTIVPVSGSTNAWEVYNRNGTPESRAPIIVPTYGATAATNTERSPEHKVENFACAEVWEGWAYGVSSGATGERVGPEWWQERNSKPSVEANYQGSVLLVHGLEDWNVDPAVAIPWTQELADSGLRVKQFLGQWAHDHPDQGSDDTRRWDWAEVLLRWFDAELRGLDVDTGPPVQVQSNDGRWRDETSWPPRDADAVRLHLTPGGLASEPSEESGFTTISLSPGPVLTTDSVEFRLPVEEELHIAGLPKVHVTATPLGPGGFLGAFLYDEAPGGERTRIGWTAMNVRFHAGGDEAQTVVPGEPVLMRMQIQPMDAVVPAGHTLVLRVSSETPSDRIPPPHPNPVTVSYGGDAHSVLELPVVHRGAEAFFSPPMPA